MSKTQKMSWPKAIMTVMKDGEKLPYQEITAKIAEKGLREITGKTPDRTVNKQLHKLIRQGRVVKVDRGIFRLRGDGEHIAEESHADTVTIRENQEEEQQYKAYGRFWRRDWVDWDHDQLWGSHVATSRKKKPDPSSWVDFSKQSGVYLLHWHGQVVYVGRAVGNAADGSLYARLKNHHSNDSRKGPRWDTFSWFGLRLLDNSGKLGDSIPEMDGDELLGYVEGILIEILLPGLNDKFGDNFGSMYRQEQVN